MSDTDIHCLVFSKDRAMQLDAFLRSARRYAPYASVTVQLGSTIKGAYDQLFSDHPEARIITDLYDGFENVFRRWLASHDRVVFHTDDDVFFRQAWLRDDKWEPVLSLRLGANTTYCHPTGLTQDVPETQLAWLLWQWRDEQGDFGYPLSLNGTVYRAADLLPLLDFPFANPTELEAGLAARADRFGPQWMTAPLHSCCVSLPHNRVSVSSGCPAGQNPDWQPQALREAFLEGWRIDLEAMDFTNVIGAHQEIPLEFRRLQVRP